jgi:undecaprenyl diphosphate synthase
MSDNVVIPRHLGFILDGNRRWARQHSIPEFDGHLAGYNALHEVIDRAYERGVECISIYIFSTENWKRPSAEVSGLMKLALRIVTTDLKKIMDLHIRVRFLGRPDGVGAKLLKAIEKAEEKTEAFTERTLAVCFNYGGQQEIVDAVKRCMGDGLTSDEVTQAAIADRLYAPEVPPVDIVVRTSGEQRLSNFMLWRTSYSEFMFLEKYWPDMTKSDVDVIIKEYDRRNRRFGG